MQYGCQKEVEKIESYNLWGSSLEMISTEVFWIIRVSGAGKSSFSDQLGCWYLFPAQRIHQQRNDFIKWWNQHYSISMRNSKISRTTSVYPQYNTKQFLKVMNTVFLQVKKYLEFQILAVVFRLIKSCCHGTRRHSLLSMLASSVAKSLRIFLGFFGMGSVMFVMCLWNCRTNSSQMVIV